MNRKNDILPANHPDPMLINLLELEDSIQFFNQKNNFEAAIFLEGVLFARLSMSAGGVGCGK